MSGTRCADCGLVNWDAARECRRCSHDLLSPSSRLDSNVPPAQAQYGVSADASDAPSPFPIYWVAASICAFFGGGMGFALYATLIGGGGSIAGAIVSCIIGTIVPLLAAYLIINDSKRRDQLKHQTKRKSETVATYLGVKPMQLPPVLMVLRAGIVLTVTIIAVVYSGEIIAKVLPSGEYPVYALALPAILAGLTALVIVDKTIAALRR